jgi:uncharacterized membrane protein
MTSQGSRGRSAVRPAAPALTVWVYESALGATAAEVRLKALKDRRSVEVLDAITVSWMPGSHRPLIGHLRHEKSTAYPRGSVLAGLVGLVFVAPAAGVAPEARLAALAQRLVGTGIDQTFLQDMKAQLHPESSALLVLSGDADLDVVRPVIERGLARGDVVLMHAQMPPGAPEILRAAVLDLQGRRA